MQLIRCGLPAGFPLQSAHQRPHIMQIPGFCSTGQRSRHLQPSAQLRYFAGRTHSSPPSTQEAALTHPSLHAQPALSARHSCRHSSLVSRRQHRTLPKSSVSDIPFPGDDQAALMFTVLETRPENLEVCPNPSPPHTLATILPCAACCA